MTPASGPPTLSPEAQQTLLKLARLAVESAAAGNEDLPPMQDDILPPAALQTAACFITLTAGANLRGCTGGLKAERPLHHEVRLRAVKTARSDPRFVPVRPEEVPGLTIEIAVLSPLTRLKYGHPTELARRLRPRMDGLLLSQPGRGATLLPQVWKIAPEPDQFLALLCEKLGVAPDAWRRQHFKAHTYQALVFSEPDRLARAKLDKPSLISRQD